MVKRLIEEIGRWLYIGALGAVYWLGRLFGLTPPYAALVMLGFVAVLFAAVFWVTGKSR